ncbi:exonuclease domain-containing protein [Micromonospora endophytica]|uniref:Exonuclease domain-containing protein n=1 Tax=Micromonospora endophytica TaxID=515350 RepID=A0A2W2D3U0_9ACTN|nr:histone-like nucleoid-structuring protein Lsr2 [Micromonospora endophytica]PZF98298.1 hypothetical protein C1I93_09415 [Micromonospora endophytica]RIW42736.1 hypothetical protein D3H59_22130 [Micromonospora endophytica]
MARTRGRVLGLLESFRRRKHQPALPTTGLQTVGRQRRAGELPTGIGFAVIDVETTGLSAGRDRVVEIAVVNTDLSGRIVDTWTTLINPGGSVGATHIHGITNADVRHAPSFAAVAGEVTSRLAGRALVAHNARFDLAFLKAEYARAGWQLPACPYLCTLDASWSYLPHLSRRRLPDCCYASGIELQEAHSALGDASATAALLASFLHPHRQPRHQHTRLPAQAVDVAWPSVPRNAVSTVPRTPRVEATPAAPGSLAALLDDLPLSSVLEEGAPQATTAYVELLAEALEDGILTDDEASALAELAKTYALTRQQVDAAHRGFLLALAHKAVEDGKVTRAERNDLLATAAVLGFADGIVKAVLDEATAALHESRSNECRPLPDPWPHGDPLRIGQGVAFTGCDELERARLEGRAQAAGLRVTGGVSRKTAVLVTDGADAGTSKARAARQYGTRIVTPTVFAELVAYVQPVTPAEPPPASRPASSTEPRKVATPANAAQPAGLPTVDPSAVRSWARQQGWPIGVRGRLPADVVAAYHAAHAEQ